MCASACFGVLNLQGFRRPRCPPNMSGATQTEMPMQSKDEQTPNEMPIQTPRPMLPTAGRLRQPSRLATTITTMTTTTTMEMANVAMATPLPALTPQQHNAKHNAACYLATLRPRRLLRRRPHEQKHGLMRQRPERTNKTSQQTDKPGNETTNQES